VPLLRFDAAHAPISLSKRVTAKPSHSGEEVPGTLGTSGVRHLLGEFVRFAARYLGVMSWILDAAGMLRSSFTPKSENRPSTMICPPPGVR
jgi:hypothetical protein